METDAVLELIVDVAARVITPRFRALDDEQVDEKAPGDLVTVADTEAEAELTAALRAAYPHAVVLGEEAYAGDRGLMPAYGRAEHAFTVDPVDGTKNFVRGSADHAVMVAELRDGEVVRSWIHQPAHGRSYVAERGAGAWRDGVRLGPTGHVGVPGDPSDWRVVTSKRRWLGESLPGLAPMSLTWVCCGLDYPSVASGEAEVALYGNGLPWDHAPGSLLLTEAGGALGGADGAPYDPTRPHRFADRGPLVVAASPELYAVVAPLATHLRRP